MIRSLPLPLRLVPSLARRVAGCTGARSSTEVAMPIAARSLRPLTALLLLGLLALGSSPVSAQSANDGFNVGATADVRALAMQADGKLLVGGTFTQFGGATRQRLARVNYDGTLDTSFNIAINGAVNAIAVHANGRIVIGGEFTLVGGQSRPFLAWLNADGSLAGSVTAPNHVVHTIIFRGQSTVVVGGTFTQVGSDNQRRFLAGYRFSTAANALIQDAFFRPVGLNGAVLALASQADGRILVGGNFTQVGDQPRMRLARFIPTASATPELDAAFTPTANGAVHALAVQQDGDIVVGGAFSLLNAQARSRIGRIHIDGGIDGGFSPSVNQTVRALVVQSDGRVLLGGEFTSVAGQTRNRIARLQLDGALDSGFNPSATNTVLALVAQFDGKVVLGGIFTSVAGQTRNRIARLYADGRLDRNLEVTANNISFRAIALQPDGRILIGGNFTSIAGQTRRGIARLLPDGSLDASFNTGTDAYDVHAIEIQADGKIYVGGADKLVRLNSNGSRDSQFGATVIAVAGTVHALVAMDDGGVIAGGSFSLVNGFPRSGIARLTAFGQVTAYNPHAEAGSIAALALQPDGKLLVGGEFTRIAGNACFGFARLHPNGQFDPMVINQIERDVRALALQPDGKILVGGAFPTVGGNSPDKLMRLQPNGTRDLAFFQGGRIGLASDATGRFGIVDVLAVQADGKIVIGGQFDRVHNQTRRNLARLHPDGSLDTSFNPDVGPVGIGSVISLAGQRDGKWLLAGPFSSVGGVSRAGIARLASDRTGGEQLHVVGDELRWLRQGSAPQAALPPQLALSLDGQTFTAVTTMEPIGGGWGVPGFAPPDVPHWLRVSARTRDGGSSSTGRLESVQRFGGTTQAVLPESIFATGFESP